MNKQLLSTTGLLLAIVLFVAFNIVVNGNFKSARVDLTENALYTLSRGSLNILASLEEPLTLRFYYSEKSAQALPSLKAYAQRVQELLQEYQRASNGNIHLYMMDPEPFSAHEQRARHYGLQSVPIEGEADPLYFGLAGTNLLDGLEVIPFFQPEKEDTLEYELTKLIYKLSNVERKTIAVMSALPVDGEQYDPLKGEVAAPEGEKPWALMGELRQMFNVTMLPGNIHRIPSSTDVLLVIHPKQFDDARLYAIEQYVLNGGKMVAFVDPYAEADIPEKDPDNPMAAMLASRSSNMERLFKAWGFERAPADVVADRKTATKVDFGARTNYQPIDYVLWHSVDENNLNAEQRITAALSRINLATPGHFIIAEDVQTTITPLLRSSDESMLVDKRVVQFRNDPVALLTKYQPGTLSYPLAIRVQGDVKSAFAEGVLDAATGERKKDKGHLAQSKQPIDVIVVADVDMLADRFWVETQDFYGEQLTFNTSNNVDFVINAIEDLTGSEGLISVRSRAGFSRPFHRVIALQRDAEKRFRTKERELQKKLKQTQQRIARMQVERSGSGREILTPEQHKEIAEFRLLANKTQQQLREVQASLRKDIDDLDISLKFFNIGLVPLLVAVLAVFTGWMRIHKRNQGRFQQ